MHYPWERQIHQLSKKMRGSLLSIFRKLGANDPNRARVSGVHDRLQEFEGEVDPATGTSTGHEGRILAHLDVISTAVRRISLPKLARRRPRRSTAGAFEEAVFTKVKSIDETVRPLFQRLEPQTPLPPYPPIDPFDYGSSIKEWAADTEAIVVLIDHHIRTGRHGILGK